MNDYRNLLSHAPAHSPFLAGPGQNPSPYPLGRANEFFRI